MKLPHYLIIITLFTHHALMWSFGTCTLDQRPLNTTVICSVISLNSAVFSYGFAHAGKKCFQHACAPHLRNANNTEIITRSAATLTGLGCGILSLSCAGISYISGMYALHFSQGIGS